MATERKKEAADRRKEKRRAIAAGEIEDDEKDDWCPEVRSRAPTRTLTLEGRVGALFAASRACCPQVRVADQRELREQQEAKDEYRRKAQVDSIFGDQPKAPRRCETQLPPPFCTGVKHSPRRRAGAKHASPLPLFPQV